MTFTYSDGYTVKTRINKEKDTGVHQEPEAETDICLRPELIFRRCISYITQVVIKIVTKI